MLLTLVLLAQTAAATPSAKPAPSPAPKASPVPAATAIPKSDGANSGLAGAASRVRLNKNVRFDDLDGTGKGGSVPASATQIQSCETKAFKPAIDSIVSRFRTEAKTADVTPRSALAAQISKLHDIRNELNGLGPVTPACAAEVVSLAGDWMDLEAADLEAFLGKSAPSYKRGQAIDKAWRDYESARLLLP